MIGTTKDPGRSVRVKNFYNNPESKDRITYFGALRPGLVRFNEFGTSKSIIMNSAKPRLDESETEALDKRLKIEGVAND